MIIVRGITDKKENIRLLEIAFLFLEDSHTEGRPKNKSVEIRKFVFKAKDTNEATTGNSISKRISFFCFLLFLINLNYGENKISLINFHYFLQLDITPLYKLYSRCHPDNPKGIE